MKIIYKAVSLRITAIHLLLACTACSNVPIDYTYPEPSDTPQIMGQSIHKAPSALGEEGIAGMIFGDSEKKKAISSGNMIPVNAYLWRASLDTIAFMPLSSADPFGGVIITDWYSPPETPKERFKLSVYILGRQLRADAIRVSVFKEQREKTKAWFTANVSKKTGIKIENQILTRARSLRISEKR